MNEQVKEQTAGWGALDDLPGNPIMWVLIVSELLVFGAFFISFAITRFLEPEMFFQSQGMLDQMTGGINTIVLVTSGYCAALATSAVKVGASQKCRLFLIAAIGLGGVFCVLKLREYGAKADQGIHIETNDFFTLFYLMTGFHFLHVIFGVVLLGIAAFKPKVDSVVTVCAFWHMVDLVWVLLFPLVYLVR